MACYSADEIHSMLADKPYLQEKLYVNGFLITNQNIEITDDYPFYGNWIAEDLGTYRIYTQKKTVLTTYRDSDNALFLIGHAVDPFDHLTDEAEILKKLAAALQKGKECYFKAQNNLTGVYCTGFIHGKNIYIINDCTGMQIVYYGALDGSFYCTSHSKLVADLEGFSQSGYIKRLVDSRFYHYMGTWLPGDLSPYPELRRLVPNHYASFGADDTVRIVRFFPEEPILEDPDPVTYQDSICWLSDTLHETLDLYAQKWRGKTVAISVTGGRDSMTTLACANGLYDRFKYFSYVSNEAERVDALAAREICRHLGLKHELYEIPQDDSELADIEAFAVVLECNAGCIGKNNPNDVRKRLFFIQKPKYDVEIKSWVNEIGRGSQYIKYNVKRFPKKPTASYCRALHKIYISPKLIHDTDIVFRSYLDLYYPEEVLGRAPWMELFWWEFCWSGGEGVFLTAEHRTSSDIAIPYNNRRYLARMLSVPLEQRREDVIPRDIIGQMNPEITKAGIVVRNLKHTDRRALLMRIYLEVFSRIHF